MNFPDWPGKAEGYVTLAAGTILIATCMCLIHCLDGTHWVQVTLGTIGVVCAGGAAAAYRK